MPPQAANSAGATAPWWRRPSPYWMMWYGLAVTLPAAMTAGPKPELLIDLACIAHPPAASTGDGVLPPIAFMPSQHHAESTVSTNSHSSSDSNSESDSFIGETIFSNTAPSPFPDLDTEKCRKDVGVQRLAARIQMGFTLMSGILAVLTTGFWGSVSDRVGRRRIIALGQVGVVLAEMALITIAMKPDILTRLGLWVMFVGPFCFGICGGMSTFNAAVTAYIADGISGSIAASFALIIGVIRVGAILGPIAGTFVINATGDVLMPFKVAVAVHSVLVIILLTILPESLSAEVREANVKKLAAEREAQRASDSSLVKRCLRRASAPLEPLRIFLPKANASFVRGDYNLTVVAAVEFLAVLTRGIDASKSQYAILALGWTQAQFGPYFSFVDLCQVAVLTGLMPLLARYLQPILARPTVSSQPDPEPQSQSELEPTEQTPLLQTDDEPLPEPAHVHGNRGSMTFDYRLLVISLIIQISGNVMLGLNVAASGVLFVVASAWNMLGSPFDPCFGSLALGLSPSEVQPGQLFGALGVVDSLSQWFLAAPLYAGVFSATLAWYPPAIFLVTAITLTTVAALVALLRLPRNVSA